MNSRCLANFAPLQFVQQNRLSMEGCYPPYHGGVHDAKLYETYV